jgi:hypothetical protein
MQVLVVLELLVVTSLLLVVLVELEQLAEEEEAEAVLLQTQRVVQVLVQVLLVQVVREELFFTASHNKQRGQYERNNIYQCAWV